MKRFPYPCASTIQIVRRSGSTAETPILRKQFPAFGNDREGWEFDGDFTQPVSMNKHGESRHRLSAPQARGRYPLGFFVYNKRCGGVLSIISFQS
jgi:hypothetical protein